MSDRDDKMQHLLQQLTDTDQTVRYDAAQALGKQGDPRAIDGLVNILGDDNPKVKYAALSSLVKIGSPTAATPTVAALLDDLDSRLWKLLTLDIGMRLRNGLFDMIEPGNVEVADRLNDALNDVSLSEHQRALVIRLIGRTEDDRLVDTFIDMMMIASETLQAAAAEALGYIGDERAVEPLITVLDDADSAVREIAINALARIGDERAGDALLPFLDSADEWTRRASATALGDLGDRRAVRKLLRMQREDDSQVVREAAGKALTQLIMNNEDE
jgi:HEAT repeat protein